MAPNPVPTGPQKAFLETPAMYEQGRTGGRSGGREEGRGQPRRALRLETSGSVEGGPASNVTVHNISAAGLLIESDLSLDVGEVLALDLPEQGTVGAEIVWQSGRLFGCAFEQALGEAALAAAQLRGGTPVIPPTAPASGAHTTAPGTPSDIGAGKRASLGVSLGAKLNRLRRGQGLTLAQVADALGVSKPTVWAWEKGKARPLAERLDAIAAVLGVASEELTESSAGSPGGAVVGESRERIAQAYGVDPQSVRIMIEV